MAETVRFDEQFKRDYFERGFTQPFELDTGRSWSAVRSHFQDLLETSGPWDDSDVPSGMVENHPHGVDQLDRHLDCSLAHEILTDTAITERLSRLYNPDMLLLFSEFMIKEPEQSADYVPWHQDGGYFGLHPSVSPSVWVAVSEATAENGALEFYPNCAPERVSHEKVDEADQWFEYEIDPETNEQFGDRDPVTVEMEPREAIIFHNAAIHRSTSNTGSEPRIALQTRSTVPYAHVNSEKRPKQPLVTHTGTNDRGVHEPREPPRSCDH